MPEGGGAMAKAGRSAPHAGPSRFAILAAAFATPLAASPALAQDPDIGALIAAAAQTLAPHEWAAFGLHVGLVVFAVVTGIGLLRARSRARAERARAAEEIGRLRLELDRAKQLLTLDPHIVVVFEGAGEDPTIEGDVSLVVDLPAARRVLAFGAWLPPDQARAMEEAVSALRAQGASFQLDLTTLQGRHIEAIGQPIGGRAVVRLVAVSGAKDALAALADKHQALIGETDAIRAFLDRAVTPAWIRDGAGRLVWVNGAYAAATEQPNPDAAIASGAELLEANDRAQSKAARAAGEAYRCRVTTIAAGARRVFDVVDMPAGAGSAGLAVDVTDLEAVKVELASEIETHKRTLDQLATPVVIFDAKKQLVFHNEAYRQLWGLDPAFLHQAPTDTQILDRLRDQGRLPEQPHYRLWRQRLHDVYSAPSLQPRELDLWHLPTGQTLRVIQNPDPAGGVTYVFHDVTRQLELEGQVNAIAAMQRETLDHLEEAVAVFQSDGRLSLWNSALQQLWGFEDHALAGRPHVDAILARLMKETPALDVLAGLKSAVAGLTEGRTQQSFRLDRHDRSTIDVIAAPLPDGATLVTFRNVTDQVAVERALTERNQALEKASQIKNDFVQHVSYQLRTPLTSIIGFAQLLEDPSIGPLNPKQREYLAYVNDASTSLLSIIDDVLDLATIDAGVMQLRPKTIPVTEAIKAAGDSVRDRLLAAGVDLEMRATKNIGEFTVDPQRMRQILYNLLTNAIGFSPKGSIVTLEAERREREVVMRVRDRGAGIPADRQGRIFDRFETHSGGSGHRGAGLGLSIVRSFVELHGGKVAVESAEGKGTTVTVIVPAEQPSLPDAAE